MTSNPMSRLRVSQSLLPLNEPSAQRQLAVCQVLAVLSVKIRIRRSLMTDQPTDQTPKTLDQDESQPPEKLETTQTPETGLTPGAESVWYGRIFLAWLYPGIGLAILWFSKRDFVTAHWIPIGVVFLLLGIAVSIPSSQRWYSKATAQRRIGIIIFSLIPLIIVFFVAVFLLDTKYQTALLRTMFLIVVCSLPALLYYLFIATKKSSLLNEFVINLGRLGLRDPKRVPPAGFALKVDVAPKVGFLPQKSFHIRIGFAD